MLKILSLDHNSPLIRHQLEASGWIWEEDLDSTYADVLDKISQYDGLILRSRIPIDRPLLEKASQLKFVARVGAGMENIDLNACKDLGIVPINSPEGNRDAVAEHSVGMLLCLMNRLIISSTEVKNGVWLREENRGDELLGKTLGLIGYGNMGQAFARRLSGFGVEVIFHDIRNGLEDRFASQVSLTELQQRAQILSFHTPLDQTTRGMFNARFLDAMQNPFYLLNTSRGAVVESSQVVRGLKEKKILGACLDVLENEKTSFETVEISDDLDYLLQSPKVLITPHIAGWTHQSKTRLAQIVVDKILSLTK